jgi:hypothetical protein
MALPIGGGEGGTSQTLNLKLVLEGEDYLQRLVEAIASTDEFQEKVQLLEALIKSVAAESGASFEEVGRSIRKVSGELELFSENTEKALGEAVKNVTEEAKAGFTSVGEAAGGFREQVNLTKQALQEISQQKGLSLQDVAEGMKQAGVNTKIVSTALKELNTELRKTAETGKKLTPAQELQRYRQQVEELKNQIRELAQAQGTTFRDAGQALQATGSPARETAAAVRELNEEAQETPNILQRIGAVGSFVFGSVLGVTATSVLRRVIDFLGQAIEVGREFNQSLFQMEVAVRGLQRVGIDTTMERFENQVRAVRNEFKLFTERELKQASAGLALYTREVGFSEEQIFELVEISAALASVTGKDVGETGFLIARALASGYTEALQRMGIAISRADITQRAMAEGLNKSFIQLTEQERATISLLLVQERTAAIMPDLIRFQETYAGQIAVAEAAQRDFVQNTGQLLLPAQVAWERFLAGLAEGVNGLVGLFFTLDAAIATFATRTGAVFAGLRQSIIQGSLEPIQMVLENLDEFSREFFRRRLERNLGITEGMGDVPEAEMGMFAQTEDEAEELADLIESVQNRLADEQLKGQQRRIEILLDFARRREDIIRDNGRKIEEMERSLQARLLEISISFNERFNKMVENFELRRAQIIRQFEIRSQEQRERRRQQAIDEERKFQEKLLRLQEDFLLNLEDAVRERDALQIIRLTRRFNLEKRQMIREFENRQQEQEEQAEIEQQQLDRQRAERLRSLTEEHQLRTKQLLRQQEMERASAARDHVRKLQEEQVRFEQRMEDLNRNREQELEDLQRAIENRLEQILQGWIQEGKVTQDNADAIYDIIAGTFGPGGRVEGVYLYFLSLLQNMATATSQITASLSGLPGVFNPGPTVTAGPFQSGGSLVATRPTTAVFGERPELVTFTPLTGPNVAPRHVGSLPAGLGGGTGQGRLGLEILLSPGLEMRIIDQAMEEMANVELSVNRGSRQ